MIFLLLIVAIVSFKFTNKNSGNSTISSANDNLPKEISISVKATEKEDLEIFEDSIIPWISISDYESQLKNLINADEFVLGYSQVLLRIDYPLNKPYEMFIVSQSPKGFTRKELVELICFSYKQVYQEEEKTTKTKVIPIEERKTLLNRNETDGKYGICCHDIEDLDLSSIQVSKMKNGKILLELGVES
jgi:hypothetical protein